LAGLFNENESFVGGCASDMARRLLCVWPGRWMERWKRIRWHRLDHR
jgi:hypothetical protein